MFSYLSVILVVGVVTHSACAHILIPSKVVIDINLGKSTSTEQTTTNNSTISHKTVISAPFGLGSVSITASHPKPPDKETKKDTPEGNSNSVENFATQHENGKSLNYLSEPAFDYGAPEDFDPFYEEGFRPLHSFHPRPQFGLFGPPHPPPNFPKPNHDCKPGLDFPNPPPDFHKHPHDFHKPGDKPPHFPIPGDKQTTTQKVPEVSTVSSSTTIPSSRDVTKSVETTSTTNDIIDSIFGGSNTKGPSSTLSPEETGQGVIDFKISSNNTVRV